MDTKILDEMISVIPNQTQHNKILCVVAVLALVVNTNNTPLTL